VLFGPAPGYEPTAVEPQFQTVLHYSARGSTDPNDMMLLPVSALQHVLGVFCSVRLPHSVGELRIRSADAAIPPSIVYGYLDPRDLERMRASVRLTLELAEQPALKRAVSSRVQPPADITESDAAMDRWILESLATSYHACGTCKLGPSTDANAVVDEHCRVRGVEGLRVVDLSIVPQSVRSGPHATVVMLAERAADLIKSAAAGQPQTLRTGRR
jgi:choline dehydrogenase